MWACNACHSVFVEVRGQPFTFMWALGIKIWSLSLRPGHSINFPCIIYLFIYLMAYNVRGQLGDLVLSSYNMGSGNELMLSGLAASFFTH